MSDKRIVIITHCNECPHFDNEYYGYHEKCKKLNIHIDREEDSFTLYKIPEECPLKKVTNEN